MGWYERSVNNDKTPYYQLKLKALSQKKKHKALSQLIKLKRRKNEFVCLEIDLLYLDLETDYKKIDRRECECFFFFWQIERWHILISNKPFFVPQSTYPNGNKNK